MRNVLHIAFPYGQERGLLGGERRLGVLDAYAVHDEGVAEHALAKAFAEAFPDTVLRFFEADGLSPGQVAGHGDRLRLGRVDLEQDLPVREGAGGLKGVVRSGLAHPLCAERQGQEAGCGEDQESFHFSVRLVGCKGNALR